MNSTSGAQRPSPFLLVSGIGCLAVAAWAIAGGPSLAPALALGVVLLLVAAFAVALILRRDPADPGDDFLGDNPGDDLGGHPADGYRSEP